MADFRACHGCGATIHVTAPSCPKCGAPQKIDSNDKSSPAKNSSSAESVPASEKTGKKRFPKSALITFALIGLGWLAYAVLSASRGGQLACNGSDVESTLKEAFVKAASEPSEIQSLGGAGITPQALASTIKSLKINLVGVRTDAKSNRKKISCDATMEISVPSELQSLLSNPMLRTAIAQDASTQSDTFSDTKIQSPIRYTAQLTDKGDEFYVEQEGNEGLRQVVSTIALLDAVKKQAATTTPAQPANETPAKSASPVSPEVSVAPVASVAATETTPVSKEANATSVQTLCESNETPVFACSTAKKQLALCMVGTGKTAALTYRIGMIGQPAEMAYPDNKAPAAKAFKSGLTRFAGEQASLATFDKGDIRYVVYAGTMKDGSDMSGVVVEKGGKQIGKSVCVKSLVPFNRTAFDDLQLPDDAREFAIP
jgi:hypothetical protein